MVTLILDCFLEPTKRNYSDPYEYCSQCGVCITRCPVNAITRKHLRNLNKCFGRTRELMALYGKGNCGKCMVGVPCESRIPVKSETEMKT
ncbi:MAG: 4Fe-4S binding protein [Oscillospiraceae bacterium]|nr:4Fe-4S binding protein [Oscillospiraceae bacterium]